MHLHFIRKVSNSFRKPPRAKRRQFNLQGACENEKTTFFQANYSGFSLWYLVAACLGAFKKQSKGNKVETHAQPSTHKECAREYEVEEKWNKKRGKSLFKFNLTLSFRFLHQRRDYKVQTLAARTTNWKKKKKLRRKIWNFWFRFQYTPESPRPIWGKLGIWIFFLFSTWPLNVL